VTKYKSLKINAVKPYIEELTVFIRVKIDNFKELSKLIPLIVNKKVSVNKDIIKIITVKKYL